MMGGENYDVEEENSTKRRSFGNNAGMNVEVFPVSTSCSPSRIEFTEHDVCWLDTLAGVAIKYGVEVADVRRMNGLVTDHQMFALKKLRIPQPGRHPPTSPPTCHPHSVSGTPPHPNNILDSFQSLKVSPKNRVSTSSRVPRPKTNKTSDPASICINPPLNLKRKSRSSDNIGCCTEEHVFRNPTRKPVRRRQKSEADFEGEGLIFRTNASTTSASRVRKSSSTPTLLDHDNNSPVSTKPVLDARKHKTALD